MTVTTDALIPALDDALEAHAAVIDRFRADMAVTPAGRHRQMLERHVMEGQDHLARIRDHIRHIHPRHLLRDTTETVRMITEGIINTARMPLQIGGKIADGIPLGPRQTDGRRLLKNAEHQYMITARALAVCRAGLSIATLAQDGQAAGLLATMRRQDEHLLQTLEYTIDGQARALVLATNGDRTASDRTLTGLATRAVRAAGERLRAAAEAGVRQTRRVTTTAGREVPVMARMTEEAQGAFSREEQLAIPRYGRLTAIDIMERLHTLSQAELTVIEGYERAHANRAGILNAIARLRGSEPWPDYDIMTPDEIKERLRTAAPSLVRRVRVYEQLHRQRPPIISAAKQHTDATT
ncbi:hypothetical protein [Streptomyces sp. NPDC005322]|uniref:hypothetical protein n=1 Tax=Streptomyces sp. NPDC005322 TaxID=3157032 RepID=UPI0033A6BA86